ncbi:MAG TPA: potassium-transporting ATPase subunit KdpA [Elusimicrobiota bacterium]|nr:potassium-transporting ATPase subunit KdpA [Elusimicrobiota bacterium]
MNMNNVAQCALYMLALLALTKPLGWYMAKIFEGEIPGPVRWLKPIERLTYRLWGVDPNEEMDWKTYAYAVLWSGFIGFLLFYLVERIQQHLPLNPLALGPVAPDVAFNAALSFLTNTQWQSYGGETTMSYLTQMLCMTVQDFISPAVGMAVLVALIRGMRGVRGRTIGNFWVDLNRGIVYILLPLTIAGSLFLLQQGIPQTFKTSYTVSLLQPTKDSNGKAVTEQTIATGPVASMIALKQMGTNGGGYFNVNSAHPYECPGRGALFVELLLVLLIPSSLTYTFGKMIGDTRQGWAVWVAMTLIFVPLLWICVSSEQSGNPAFTKMGVTQAATALQPGGNMEGKDVRFGIASSAIWATAITATSNGSVCSMHDSFTPIGGLIPLVMMKLGEVIYGGVGSGMYGMMVFVIIAVFLAGLMVGRTPEYMGKKIESYEIKMASIAALIPLFFVLVGSAIAVVTKSGLAGLANPGPHGLSEVLYAFASAGNNNGSAFAGLTASTPFYDILLSFCIMAGRYGAIIPVLAIAGSLLKKKSVPMSAGTLPTHTPLFIAFLASVVVIVGALTFFPAWSLGPIVEHLMMVGA